MNNLMEGQVQIQPNKIKRQEIMDRISDLQDGLLLDILSRLDSTKEAIRTGVLSKRWEHLWPSVPSLTFNHPENNNVKHPHPDPDFFSFVNHALTQCRQLNLNKFKLYTKYDIQFESLVNEWIRYAVNLNVKEFDLRLRTPIFEPAHTLDQICFINSNFTRLRLSGCIFKPTGGISWTNLKSLTLSNVKVDEDLIQNFLSGSPMLETLNLIFVYGFKRIDIRSKSVKNLVFAGFMDREQAPNTEHVEINAPFIFSLKIDSLLILSKLVLLNVSSLVKAELNYTSGLFERANKEVEEEMLKGLILKLRHVEELKIGFFCLELGKPQDFATEDVKLYQDVIKKNLSGCPLLETLELDHCYGFELLDTTNKSVKNLSLIGCLYDLVEINAPHILSLAFKEYCLFKDLVLLNVSSVVKAELDYCCEKEEMLIGLKPSLRHVKSLKIER